MKNMVFTKLIYIRPIIYVQKVIIKKKKENNK